MDAGWKLINQRNKESGQHAAELFQAALKDIDPKSPDLYNGLGRALLIAGQPREAIAAWRAGLGIAPTLADMQSGIGWAYWHLNDPYRAKKAWEAAIAIDPKSADAWSALAWVDLATGDAQTAKLGFQTLLARDSHNNAWIMGLSMARANNSDPEQIKPFFPLPNIGAFDHPVANDPAETVASTAKSE
jgi:tetratricopeptide (TPR) repeat protein